MKPRNTYAAINSIPCFEYWLLLHFENTTKPYGPLSGNSACHQVVKDLKKYMPLYSKGDMKIFPQIKDKIPFAINNATKSLKAAEKADTDNPTTRVHELVRFLQNIKG